MIVDVVQPFLPFLHISANIAMPELLTPQEVARSLKISVRAVRDLLSSGELPSFDVTVNRDAQKVRRRVSVKSLEDFLRSRASNPMSVMCGTPAMVGQVVDRY